VIYLLLIWLLLPIPIGNQVAAYNTLSQTFFCVDQYYCWHEEAHYIDFQNGMISHSKEYKEVIIIYVFTNNNDLSRQIVGMLGNPIEEIYAEIYARTNGSPPEIMKPFYPDYQLAYLSVFGGKFYYGIHNTNKR